MGHDEQNPGARRPRWRPFAAALSALVLVGAVALSLTRAPQAAGTLRIRAGSLAVELRPCGGDFGAHPFSDPLAVQKLVMKTPRLIQPPLPAVPPELRAFVPSRAAGEITLQPFTMGAHERGSLSFESSEDGALLLGSLVVRSDRPAGASAQVQSRVVFAWRGDVRLDPTALRARSPAAGDTALVEAVPDVRRPLQLRFETKGAAGLLRNDRLCIAGLRVGREVPDGVGPPRFQSTVRGGEIKLGLTDPAIALQAGDRITVGPGLVAELRELSSAPAGPDAESPQLSAVIVADSLSGLRINEQARMPSLLASWVGALTSSAAFIGLAAATRALEGLRKLFKAVASLLEPPGEKGNQA